MDMDLFTPHPEEYIDLHDGVSDELKRQKLYDLTHREDAIISCRFCKGTDGKIRGGVQMEDVKRDL